MSTEVVLDFSRAASEDDVWVTIRAGLCPNFAEFGANLDALVDVLRGGFGVGTPFKLRILGKDAAKAAVGAGRWQQIETTFDESVAGEFGEDVESVEWVSPG
jgi:hypothetical protein